MLLLPALSNAAVVSAKPNAVGVTIYRASEEGNPNLSNPDVDAEGIALISEARELELPQGESVVEFVGVAETIVPQSARLDSLPGVIAETNFDYKVISPGELIANSIGQSVRLVRTDKDTGKITEQRARLVSGPDGVLLDVDGKIEALDCSGASERLVFDSVPENLRSKPVLSAKVRVSKAGRHIVRLSYLATGFDWSANYVARIQHDGRTLDLTGWVTLANKQDTSFVNAPVQVVAGNIERDESTESVELVKAQQKAQCWPTGSFIRWSRNAPLRVAMRLKNEMVVDSVTSEDVEQIVVTGARLSAMAGQRDLGDYKLYELPFKSDVPSRQVKQVMMTHHRQVLFERIYTYTLSPDADDLDDDFATLPSNILVRMQNKRELGLGKSLPAGNVVVMESDGTQSLVAGINKIKDSPVGMPIDVEVGSTPEVSVIPKVVREYEGQVKRVGYEYIDLEVALVNRQSRPVQFEFRQDTSRDGVKITKESVKHIMHKGLPTWVVKIPPRSQKAIRYTLRRPD